jgi:hypothetical protein
MFRLMVQKLLNKLKKKKKKKKNKNKNKKTVGCFCNILEKCSMNRIL